MTAAFGVSSFQSIWYWVLTVLVWTLVTHRTLGVPYDMLLRARRLPEAAEDVGRLGRINAARVLGLKYHAGVPLVLAASFAVTFICIAGFGYGLELAKATALLVVPLSAVAWSTLTMAVMIGAENPSDPVIVRMLSRRHFWHQFVAVMAIITALAVAIVSRPALIAS